MLSKFHAQNRVLRAQLLRETVSGPSVLMGAAIYRGRNGKHWGSLAADAQPSAARNPLRVSEARYSCHQSHHKAHMPVRFYSAITISGRPKDSRGSPRKACLPPLNCSTNIVPRQIVLRRSI
ncbi:hypothetical protein EVAR_75472_1 [Eumeta japonica]|uniref:Uncharacterized protein n=1 Tax=Eumeta variegata TaxID=151549 RepID=A0A4C1TLC3_EUMVA|nr:hypothetical protein EVAR_75472_1 [Eumeta japonica]